MMTADQTNLDKRLDLQKVAVAWLVYAATLGILFLASMVG